MEERFRVFGEKYNKMLDLVEIVDEEVANKYKKVMSKMPSRVLEKLENEKEFCYTAEDLRIDKDCYDEMIEFQYTTYRKYFNASMNIYPFYEDELLEEIEEEDEIEIDPEIAEDEDGCLFIFSLTMSNTMDEAKIRFNFEENKGDYKFVGVERSGIEIDYSVFIEIRDEEYFLISKHMLNGVEIKKIEKPISYEELLEYACTDYEDDEEYDCEIDDDCSFNDLN